VVAQVGAAAATILEPLQLLQTVVNLTKSNFKLYHAHVYLLNDAGDALELAAGAGEVGHKMVAQGWRIPLSREQSLVARAARTQTGVIINDVTEEPGFLPNALLPDTRSEMAVPIAIGGLLLGVLDVQADEPGRFTDEDLRIQGILATQIAVALQNARQFAEARRLADREALVNAISQQIQNATTVESALQIAARELGRALGAQRTVVQLGQPDNAPR
jgi:GAF domain-containing protein